MRTSETSSPCAALRLKMERKLEYWFTSPDMAMGGEMPSDVGAGLPKPCVAPPKVSACTETGPGSAPNCEDQSLALSESRRFAFGATNGSRWKSITLPRALRAFAAGKLPPAPAVNVEPLKL